jgi:hypothetical protein
MPCLALAQDDPVQQAVIYAQIMSLPCCITYTAQPKFSVRLGRHPGPIKVTITDASRGAVIYYSTDGWTPTVSSLRYRGPILIDSSTTLQAIAAAPYSTPSTVASVEYIISNPLRPSPIAPATGSVNEIPVPLLFDADVNSRTASVGDSIPLTLAADLLLDGEIVKRGTAATGTVTQVDHAGMGGAPGSLSFEIDALQMPGGPLQLRGGASREGKSNPPNAAILIPLVGGLAMLRHGTDAVIARGSPFTAYVNIQRQGQKK